VGASCEGYGSSPAPLSAVAYGAHYPVSLIDNVNVRLIMSTGRFLICSNAAILGAVALLSRKRHKVKYNKESLNQDLASQLEDLARRYRVDYLPWVWLRG